MARLMINTSGGEYLIDTGIIVRIEASSNYSKVYFSDGTVLVAAKLLRWFEEKLEPGNFTRLHRSHLVNTDYLRMHQVAGNMITLRDGIIIPVSRRRKKLFWQKFAVACFLI